MITTKDLKKLEEKANLDEVMENAGKAVYKEIQKRFNLKNKKIVIFAWHGNNGGDGFVSAYYLSKKAKVKVLFFGNENKLTELAKKKYERVKKLIIKKIEKRKIKKSDIIIDAMLGTGIKGKIKEPLSSAIDIFNSIKAFKVSIDIPTGINPDTGRADKYIKPDLIITFHDMKPGLKKFKNKVVVRKIGL